MTSKHLFSKVMKEDMRGKIWMGVLSILANMMAILVAFLIFEDSYGGNHIEWTKYEIDAYHTHILEFFETEMMILGGIVAGVGAIIVGLFGFRFLYSKRMVDTYHSLPVKRSTQFWAIYLNGVLLWFVPFIVSVMLTVVIGITKMLRFGNWELCSILIGNAAGTVVALVVVFSLVYHLFLVAVMISGNVWNSLLSAGVLGCGPIAIYGLAYAFYEYYMETFYYMNDRMEAAIYASPLVSAVYLLYVKSEVGRFSYVEAFWWNAAIVVVLLALAFFLYRKRASELAEQGVKYKAATYYMRLIIGLVAAMGGWMIFILLTDRDHVGWGIFGSIFFAVLILGIVNIIFNLDFKAFFKDKIFMAGITVFSVLACLSFSYDWFGYDTYLPKKENIKEMGIYCSAYSNHYVYMEDENSPIEKIRFTDADMIYAFLEEGVKNIDGRTDYNSLEELCGYYKGNDIFWVKVTLNSGRSYYRIYDMYEEDGDVYLPLIEDPEYLVNVNYIEDGIKEDVYRITLRTDNQNLTVENEFAGEIIDAYNQDLVNNPKGVVFGEGRLLARLQINTSNHRSVQIDIYETMTETISALEKHGYGNALRIFKPEEVDHIELYTGNAQMHDAYGNVIDTDYEMRARKYYQVWDAESMAQYNGYWQKLVDLQDASYRAAEEGEKYIGYEDGPTAYVGSEYVYDIPVVETVSAQKEAWGPDERWLMLTEEEDIKELLELLSYEVSYMDGTFSPRYADSIVIVDKKGERWNASIKLGILPEKYVEMFGELKAGEIE